MRKREKGGERVKEDKVGRKRVKEGREGKEGKG